MKPPCCAWLKKPDLASADALDSSARVRGTKNAAHQAEGTVGDDDLQFCRGRGLGLAAMNRRARHSALVFSARDFPVRGWLRYRHPTNGLVSFATCWMKPTAIRQLESESAGPRGELLGNRSADCCARWPVQGAEATTNERAPRWVAQLPTRTRAMCKQRRAPRPYERARAIPARHALAARPGLPAG